ncbi:spore gernimation protein GerT [Metabacillus arenae]|uniref:Spore gernimation protein GerT n=1 Tax=Metabacillus arenae TaxID=2771434 RepID=A0A926N7X4_9BACI|nr:spore gernimation protein GerT [Metabacillus arenae]MBD1379027.1 spore gernimation protein GerT [Metabacillus arenae]
MFPWNKGFPFHKMKIPDQFKDLEPNQVEEYVQDVMKNVFGNQYPFQFPFQGEIQPNSKNDRQSKKYQIECFETSEYIYVKIPLEREKLAGLKIQHTSHQLIIHNYPEEGETEKVSLPSLVKRKGTKTHYKDSLLEIKLIKNEDHYISEVVINDE